MTVKELREMLERMPQDVEVFYDDAENGRTCVRQVNLTSETKRGFSIVLNKVLIKNIDVVVIG